MIHRGTGDTLPARYRIRGDNARRGTRGIVAAGDTWGDELNLAAPLAHSETSGTDVRADLGGASVGTVRTENSTSTAGGGDAFATAGPGRI